MSHYPQEFPTEETTHLYEMASTGTLRDNIPHATHDAWWVSGFLLKFSVGEPDNHGAVGDVDSNAAIVAACNLKQLEQLQSLSVLAGITAEDLAQPGADPSGILDNIDIDNLLTKIQKIVALLKMLGLIP